MSRRPLVRARALSRHFGTVRALDRLDLAIEEGEWVAVTGPSGSGKTTLLNLLAGLDRPTSGDLEVGDLQLATTNAAGLARYRRETIGLVFQHFHLMAYLTALENVMLAQYVHSVTDRSQAEAALRHVGLGHRLEHLPSELSGGEQQRVAIARALINEPKLILADEPTGNLDAANEVVVMELLSELHAEGTTLVLVTHDAEIAARAGREVRLEHGRLAAATPTDRRETAFYLHLWRLLEEDRCPVAVGRPGVAEAMARGHLEFREGGLALTDSGHRHAAFAVRQTRLAEVLLERTLAGGDDRACGHVAPLARGVVEEVDAFLGRPGACPHGRPIPPAVEAEAVGSTAPEARPSRRPE